MELLKPPPFGVGYLLFRIVKIQASHWSDSAISLKAQYNI
jgi:hypothetical protein